MLEEKSLSLGEEPQMLGKNPLPLGEEPQMQGEKPLPLREKLQMQGGKPLPLGEEPQMQGEKPLTPGDGLQLPGEKQQAFRQGILRADLSKAQRELKSQKPSTCQSFKPLMGRLLKLLWLRMKRGETRLM